MNAAITINRTDVDGVPTFWVDTGRPTLSATLVFRAGLMDEPPARSGWLHLLEHVVMTGPEQHGLAVNGSVDLAFTTFDAEGDPAEVCAHLRRITDRLSAVPEIDLDHERQILAAEEREHGPATLDLGLVWRFGSQGPARAVFQGLGLGAADLAGLRELSQRLLTRGNAALILSGPPPAGLSLTLADGPAWPRTELPPMLNATGCYVHNVEGLLLHGVVPRTAAGQVTTMLMGHRLRESLRHRDGMAYSPGTDYLPVSPTRSILVASVDVEFDETQRASATMLSSINDLLLTGPSSEDLRRIVAERERDAVDPYAAFDWAALAARRHLEGLGETGPDQVVDEVRAVQPADVMATVGEFIATSMLGVPDPDVRPAIPLPPLDDPVDPTPAAPTSTHRAVIPLPGSPVIRTIDGGLHVAGKGVGMLFRFADVVACQATPNGTRRLIRGDGTSTEVATDAFHQGDQLRRHIDAGLDPSVVVPVPDPAGEEPVPTRGELGKDVLTALLWIALTVAIVGGLILQRLRPDLISIGTLGVIVAVVALALAVDGIRTWLRRRARTQP